MRRTTLLIGWTVLLGLGPLTATAADRPERQASLAANAGYRLGPGDVLEIIVFEVEELSKPAVISPDGAVVLPLIGAVEVAGLTTREAAARLRELYSNNLIRDPQIAVSVKEYHSQPVTVLGAVAKPGVYQLRGPRRLSDVIALAEGLAGDAGGHISISRPTPAGEETIAAPTAGLLSFSDRLENNPWVQAHDTIRVSKAGIVYVVGDVGRPGGFPFKDQEQLTVLKAISLAEGLRRTAAAQKSRILRGRGAEQQEIPVRVRDILDGRAPDQALVPNDILFIPNSQAKGAMARGAEAALQIATGVIIFRR